MLTYLINNTKPAFHFVDNTSTRFMNLFSPICTRSLTSIPHSNLSWQIHTSPIRDVLQAHGYALSDSSTVLHLTFPIVVSFSLLCVSKDRTRLKQMSLMFWCDGWHANLGFCTCSLSLSYDAVLDVQVLQWTTWSASMTKRSEAPNPTAFTWITSSASQLQPSTVETSTCGPRKTSMSLRYWEQNLTLFTAIQFLFFLLLFFKYAIRKHLQHFTYLASFLTNFCIVKLLTVYIKCSEHGWR